MIARRKIALKYKSDEVKRGAPAPCFTPDFDSDSALYKEIDGLNEISVAQSKHELSSICSVRLQEVPSVQSFSADDDTLMNNIAPKSMDVSQLLEIAHRFEHDALNELNNNNFD